MQKIQFNSRLLLLILGLVAVISFITYRMNAYFTKGQPDTITNQSGQ